MRERVSVSYSNLDKYLRTYPNVYRWMGNVYDVELDEKPETSTVPDILKDLAGKVLVGAGILGLAWSLGYLQGWANAKNVWFRIGTEIGKVKGAV